MFWIFYLNSLGLFEISLPLYILHLVIYFWARLVCHSLLESCAIVTGVDLAGIVIPDSALYHESVLCNFLGDG